VLCCWRGLGFGVCKFKESPVVLNNSHQLKYSVSPFISRYTRGNELSWELIKRLENDSNINDQTKLLFYFAHVN